MITKSQVFQLFSCATLIVIIISSVTSQSFFLQQDAIAVSSVNNNKALNILSHNSFVDSAGYFHVVGEVENKSPNLLESVKVIGTFYDSTDMVVGTDFTFTNPAKLPAGDKAPFELILTSASIPVKEIHNYRLSLDWQKGGGGTTLDLPSDFGLSDIVIGNENFVEKTGSDTVDCGEKVRGTIILTANLTCSNHGLIVGNNTVVNMNGYSIRGPGQESSKIGLVIPNVDNVVVYGPGDISNFQAGILVRGANHLNLSSLILEQNKRGLDLQNSNDLHMEQNIIKDNNIGIASKSSDNMNISSSLFNGNTLAGVTFENTHDSTVFSNNIDGSQNGVFADALSSRNVVAMNNILHNVIDINNANGLSTKDNNNRFSDNNCQVSNPRGLC